VSAFKVDRHKCNFCGMCVAECSPRIIYMEGAQVLPSIIEGGEERCRKCGHCVAVCPTAAVSIDTMKAEECASLNRELLPTAEQVELLLKSRRSIRSYEDKSVPRDTLQRLIEIARYAPSGHNTQPVRWLIVEESKETRLLAGLVAEWMRSIVEVNPQGATDWGFDRLVDAWDRGEDMILRGAPNIIVAHADKVYGPLGETACVIAMTYLELAAYSLDLGACWAGYFQVACGAYPPLMEALELPQDHRVYAVMMVGYPRNKFRSIPLRNEPEISWHRAAYSNSGYPQSR
jgi:nitroreductase/Pyruvate/2-oxoacid:ferredoxin oxidoreductase delta subunit